jgi:hypothetical protein
MSNTALTRPQVAVDFGVLQHKCLPSNIDGITERCGRFLVLEIKQVSEDLTEGQWRALKALSSLPQFDVLLIRVKTLPLDENNARPFHPIAYSFIGDDLSGGLTTPERFRKMYIDWCSNPLRGKANFAEVV